MTTTTKIQHKGQVTIPTRVREQAGLSKGDLVEFSFHRGKIVMTPKLIINRAQFPDAAADYTPAQRRAIDARLAESAAQLKQGRTQGPFDSADQMIAHMKAELEKGSPVKKTKRGR